MSGLSSPFRPGIRRQLALLAVALTIPLAVLAVVRAFERAQRERRELAEQGRQAAMRATQLLDDDVTRARLLLAGASRLLDPREPTARNDSLIAALFRDASSGFSNIWLADAQGNVRGTLVPLSMFRRMPSLATAVYFRDVVQSGQFTISQPVRSIVDSAAQWVIPFMQPVREAGSGALLGYVGAGLRIDRMAAVRYMESLPPNSVLTVLRSDGRVFLRSLDLEHWIERNFAESTAFRDDPKLPSTLWEMRSLDGTNRIVAQQPLRTFDAIAYVGVPVTASLAQVQRQLRVDLLLGLLLITAMSAVAIIFASRIAGPIEEVTLVATALAQGETGRRATVHGVTEVAELGRAMNAMADAVADREQALAQSEARYRQLFATSPLPTVIWRLSDGRLEQVNDAARAFFGERADLEERTRILDLFDEGEHDRFASLPLPIESGTLRAGAWQVPDARGDLRTMELVIGRLERQNQTLAMGVLLDVTDRLRAEVALEQSRAALQQAQQLEALGAFAGGIAHDFNNYLSAIATNAELLRDAPALDDDERREASEILAAAQRASHLTKQILVFSRRQVVQEDPIDINAELQGLEHLVTRLVGERVAVELDCAADVPAVMFSPERFEQVILNLAANARDAMPQGGRLTFTTRRRGDDRVTLTVSDSGQGIAADVLPRIFEPFFTTKSRDRGTGLGLAMVYNIVTGSRGDIRVTSAPGAGTTFHLSFPAAMQAATRETRADQPAASMRGREHILVVEDDSAVRSATVALLARAGYQVSSAAGAAEAEAALAAMGVPPQLLLSDVVMPDVSGPELVARVEHRYPNMRVVFMSGFADDDAVMRGVAARELALVAKPFSASELLGTIRRILDAAST
ncbi:MAG: response regulator [Gemmatimonadaceae bacterium]|nr:response regulator [Gemmatimonadaceae bacterium]